MPQLSLTQNSTTETTKARAIMKCVIYMTQNMRDLLFNYMCMSHVFPSSKIIPNVTRCIC